MNPNLQANLMNTLGYGNGLGGAATTSSSYGPYSSGYKGITAPAADPYAYDKGLLSQGQALLDEIRRQSAPKPFTYSNFDIAANSAKARSQAEGAVNPLYTKKLQDYLDQQRTLQARQQTDAATSKSNLDEALSNVLAANETTKSRTAQDTSTNLAGIADQSQQYQQDTGQQFNQARLALLRGGQDTGAGLGAQQVGQQQAQRNTQEGRQATTFQQAKDQQNLAQSRTFEDLARSGQQATTATGKQKGQVDLSLARYIEDNGVGTGSDLASIIANSGTSVKGQANQLEGQRLQDILSQQNQYERANYLNFLNTLTGQNKVNTSQVYNGLF